MEESGGRKKRNDGRDEEEIERKDIREGGNEALQMRERERERKKKKRGGKGVTGEEGRDYRG